MSKLTSANGRGFFMPRFDKRHAFAAMARGQSRKYQMTTKAPKEQIPALLAELVNRQSNLKTIEILQGFLATVHVAGQEAAANLHRCFSWLTGVSQGEAARVKELQELLPEHDMEISMSGPQPQDVEQVVPPESTPDVAVGGVELGKGSPVLGQA